MCICTKTGIQVSEEAIPLATGLVVGFPPCPSIDYFREFIETWYGIPVVVGAHPIPEHYVEAHNCLPSCESVTGTTELMTTPDMRVAYE